MILRKLITLVLTFSLLLPVIAEAGKGGSSSGGRSYSSGGRSSFSGSSGRSYSSGSHSSSSHSSSSHSGSSGKSYSSGSHSSGSGGKTYSSGSSSKTSSGGKTYSGGSSSTPSTTSGNKTYSSGKSTGVSGATATTTSNSQKPTRSTYDSAALKSEKTAESKAAYKKTFDKGDAPKTEYKDSKGTTVKIDPKDKKIDSLRTQLDHQKWVNRDLREENFYHRYYGGTYGSFWAPGVYYHDPYNPFFFLWLWDQSLETRAMWLYCHHASMDSARYSALLAKDAQLEARIRQLEAQKTVRDTAYTPKGVDVDLMYTSDYVDAAYNPVGQPVVVASSGGTSTALGWICGFFLVAIIVGGLIYAVFIHRW